VVGTVCTDWHRPRPCTETQTLQEDASFTPNARVRLQQRCTFYKHMTCVHWRITFAEVHLSSSPAFPLAVCAKRAASLKREVRAATDSRVDVAVLCHVCRLAGFL
jgi:hypothetical protein